MKIAIQQPELQLRTLRLYGEFLCRRESWAGKLAFAAFREACSTGFAVAASLAGASSLVVDSDAEGMKAYFRDGAFDFVVNTLDEALRAIKNEVRQGRAIAIGVVGDPDDVLDEAVERGLTADLALGVAVASRGETLAVVSERDAVLITHQELLEPSPELRAWLLERGWSPGEIPARKTGISVSENIAADDRIRRKWLRDLPTHQRSARQGNRWMWLSLVEQQRCDLSSESH